MNFQIKGGKQLQGTIVTNTAKNSAVVLLCAALLNKNITTLYGVPRIEEVNRIIEVLESLKVKLQWRSNHILEITPPKKIFLKSLNVKAAIKTRSIILLLGVLVHDLNSFQLPQPGGCKLGARTIRPHFFALEKMSISIKTLPKAYQIKHNGLKPANIVLYESGDTVTENAIMAGAKTKGTTIIKFASCNYQVQDLCYLLTRLGVKIKGIGTTTLTIEGKPHINKPITYHISEDPIESMLFLSVAATTNSSLTIKRCPIDFLELELLKLEKMGFRYKILRRYKGKNKHTNLVDIKTFPSLLIALEEKIYARPYPGLNIDNLPFFVPIATQARGTTLIHDWVYEKRALYYTELTKLGADIILADPHRVYIKGPTKLTAREIICPPALRPAAIILIAMLKAKGISLLRNVYSINRGYEDLAKRLKTLNADIEII
ncbi:UDP-N-acetylglucosamine 1-carboxyvinyltransferase [Patescibacteria group bacterium AH-259-L07]|nr:UDP-N-acetylglucosamine 1-carboxyvinyltransferase [Patescibacteria group bacterium AH-259-L07]